MLGTEKKKGTGGKPLEVKETAREPAPPKPKVRQIWLFLIILLPFVQDLTQVPVYLTELQRDLFFKPLKPLFNTAAMSDGIWQCGECGEVLKCIKVGIHSSLNLVLLKIFDSFSLVKSTIFVFFLVIMSRKALKILLLRTDDAIWSHTSGSCEYGKGSLQIFVS